jgi:hypothetical protein
MKIEAPLTLANLSFLKTFVHGEYNNKKREESESKPKSKQQQKLCS